jgi:hypothetical protein
MSERATAAAALNYSKVVERYARFFDRPEVRLRFLHNTLAKQTAGRERADAFLARHPRLKNTPVYGQLLKLWSYQLIFQELCKLLPKGSERRALIANFKTGAPLGSRLVFGCYRFRHALAAPLVILLAASLFGAYTGLAWAARGANDLLANYYGTSKPAAPAAQAPAPSTVYAQTLKDLPDYKPEKVWLVESGQGFERYSNGARVLTDLETANHRRGFYAYARGEAKAPGELKREPVGIVYHTSENDMLPFTPDNSDSIETRSRGLLEYVRRHKSYNYVIDRFGQIYKIVRDEDAANHAGNSVWSDDRATFVGLNESFLGVCFETTMSAGAEERLTEAQLVAGRLLTQVLRSRHQIEDAYCVTHGLVSVNPSNMRILFHHDWARGFPFAAFGLSDKYAVAPASVAEFGFTYDEEEVGKLGGALWPGVAKAEESFGAAAERAGAEPEEFRKKMRESYRERMELQRRARVAEAGRPETPDAAGGEE